MVSRVRAVVFDLYETLITEVGCWRSGSDPTPAQRLGVPAEVFDRVWRERKHDRMTRPVDFRDVLREACRAAGVEPDGDVITRLHTERLEAKARPLRRVHRPVLTALEGLRRRGIPLGLVSNCSVEEVAAWDRSPLAPLFDVAVFSYAVGAAKPDVAVYHQACNGLDVPAPECAFVGDGGSDELDGARRAGLQAYRARWFAERWPQWRTSHPATSAGFPALSAPAELAGLPIADRSEPMSHRGNPAAPK